MTIQRHQRLTAAAVLSLAGLAGAAGPQGQQVTNDIEISRDFQGTPHIKAPTAEKAFHGLGYMVAQDRLFQMEFFRRSMRGSLAAIFSDLTHPEAGEKDRRARTIGFGHYVDDLWTRWVTARDNSDPSDDPPAEVLETMAYLEAYAQGVNKRIDEHRAPLGDPWPFMFQPAQLDLQDMADWEPADSLLVWLYPSDPSVNWEDVCFDATAVGNEKPDLGGAVLPGWSGSSAFVWSWPLLPLQVARQLAERELWRQSARGLGLPPLHARKASHNAVFHGQVTQTGAPLMLAKPQHRVANPSYYYEFALTVEGGPQPFEFRGAALPGSPGAVHGWNRELAWSLTSLKVDIADMYLIRFHDATHQVFDVAPNVPPEHYVSDYGLETVVVKDGMDLTARHRRTRWGPLVTELVDEKYQTTACTGFTQPAANYGWAVRSAVLDELEDDRSSLTASLLLMRAADKGEMVAATRHWGNPTAHMLVALRSGEIGYRSLVALPQRPAVDPNLYPGPLGRVVLDGNLESHSWPRIVNFEQMPAYLGSSKELLSSGNNLAANPARMPVNANFVLGGLGDTDRSWRMREAAQALVDNHQTSPISIAKLLTLSRDTVHPPMRTFVALARHMETLGYVFDPQADAALQALDPWGGPRWEIKASDPNATTYVPYLAALNAAISGLFGYAELEGHYGARGAGVLRMLRAMSPDVVDYYDNQLDLINPLLKPELNAWVNQKLALAEVRHGLPAHNEVLAYDFVLTHQWNLNELRSASSPGHPADKSNWPAGDVSVPNLDGLYGGTIWSQKGETYKFIADLADPDNNLSLLAPGVSEGEDDWLTGGDPLSNNTQTDWVSGSMYRAQLTWDPAWTPLPPLSYP